MTIKASTVKELRDKTGAGMLDCKKALQETGGDIAKAIDYLREKGISKAQKRAGRVAAEGLANVVKSDDKAVMYELNSETDFVAKNKEFQTLMQTIGQALLSANATNIDEALEIKIEDKSLSDYITESAARIGEKIALRRIKVIEKSASQVFGTYVHMGGKIAVTTLLEGGDEETARDIAMHVAAINPQYLKEDDISQDVIDHEKEVLRKEALNEGKPEHIVDKMVKGRLNKYLKEICLVHQPFVKDQDISVGDYAKKNEAEIVAFTRFEVGEGIEKEENDFASEVQSQISS